MMHETARFVSGSAQILFFVLDITRNEHVCFFYQTEKTQKIFVFKLRHCSWLQTLKFDWICVFLSFPCICFLVSKRLGNGANEERIIISLLRKMDSAGEELKKKNWNERTNQRKKERKKRGKERRERTWNNDFFRPE